MFHNAATIRRDRRGDVRLPGSLCAVCNAGLSLVRLTVAIATYVGDGLLADIDGTAFAASLCGAAVDASPVDAIFAAANATAAG